MPNLIIDACCLINLFATNEFSDVVKHVGFIFHVTKQVLTESLFIRAASVDDKTELRRIELEPHVKSGLLNLCAPSNRDELDLYVKIAEELDDGEAASITIAALRNMTVATDDRKARRVAKNWSVPIITTPELMKRWVENGRPSTSRAVTALRQIEFGARFIPARGASCWEWWNYLTRQQRS